MGSPPSDRVEEAEMKHALEAGEQQGDGDDRSPEDKNDAGGVMSPNEKWQAKPGHPRRAHGVNGDDEIQARQDGGEAVDENSDHRRSYRGIGIDTAQRRVEGPAGVQAAGREGVENEAAAKQVDIPAQEIDLGEGEILGADHERYQEISQDRGNRRDQEEKDHRHAVHGEQLVVGFRRNQVAVRRQQVNADHGGERAADEKEEGHRREIQQRDALVIRGQQP